MPLLSLRTMALRECLGRIDPDGLRLLVVLRCCAEAQFLVCRWSPVHPDSLLDSERMAWLWFLISDLDICILRVLI